MKFPKIEFKYLVLSVILGVNIVATLYTVHKPEREDKLFELYFASVAGLYGFATQQSFSGGNGGGNF